MTTLVTLIVPLLVSASLGVEPPAPTEISKYEVLMIEEAALAVAHSNEAALAREAEELRKENVELRKKVQELTSKTTPQAPVPKALQ